MYHVIFFEHQLYNYIDLTVNDILFVSSSEDLSRLAARKYARVVQKLDFPVSPY